MCNKCFELLKEQLLWQSAGGFDSYNKSIDLTIQIYCELCNIDEQEYKEKVSYVKSLAWDNYYNNVNKEYNNWETYQKNYEKLIDLILYVAK